MGIKKTVVFTAASLVGAASAFAKPIFTKPGHDCGQFIKPGVCMSEPAEQQEACIEEVKEHNRKVAECLRDRNGVDPATFDLIFSEEN